ncbi:MAG TPA: NAD(P)H-dependent glycerol-3-phosphate dehydrogenase [Saprospiraceae bacterium]|nr:NAD(P)H-dependent glycerol-3-phosphate dehydrogenase [Saprospiraceae bacterium]
MSRTQLNQRPTVGVIGAGSFGLTVAQLLAISNNVLLFARDPQVVKNINETRTLLGVSLSPRITAISSFAEIAAACEVLFPVIPSDDFRTMMKTLGPLLTPRHILIHGTKGLDTSRVKDIGSFSGKLRREDVRTMSEVIHEESNVLRVGCLSGPNLSKEILEGQPTATVIASEYDEVVTIGIELLTSKKMFVFGSSDILGAELAGAFKNIIAVGSGFLRGKGLGKNMQGLFITRGLHEITFFGGLLGADKSAFLGTAGIGDLIATATSSSSRNFMFGFQLGQGKSLKEIMETSDELAEGVRTLRIAYLMAKTEKIRLPIIETLYKIVFENLSFEVALDYLMRYPYSRDVSIHM